MQDPAERFAAEYTFNTLTNICGFQSFNEASAMMNMLDIKIETRRAEFLALQQDTFNELEYIPPEVYTEHPSFLPPVPTCMPRVSDTGCVDFQVWERSVEFEYDRRNYSTESGSEMARVEPSRLLFRCRTIRYGSQY